MVWTFPTALSVLGRNFTQSSRVHLDGQPVPTIFRDVESLEGNLPTDIFLTPATHQITVVDPNRGTSNAVSFRIYEPELAAGDFYAQRSFFAGRDFRWIDVGTGDFDCDGFDDVVVTGNTSAASTDGLFFLRSQGNGLLSVASRTNVQGMLPQSLAVGDVNQDSLLDVVIVNMEPEGGGPYLQGNYTVLLGDGRGNFSHATNALLPGSYQRGRLADLTGDSRLDLIVAVSETPSNRLLLLPGQGGGQFGSPQTLAILGYPRDFTIADFNRDQLLDVAFNGPDQIRLLRNQGGGSFLEIAPTALAGLTGLVVAGDFNADQRTDLFCQPANWPGTAQVFLGQGDGTFIVRPRFAIGRDVFLLYNFATGDFDNDGILDLAGVNFATHPSHILLLWGRGDGSFALQQVNGPYSFWIARGDFNSDGIADVATANRLYHVTVMLGRAERESISSPTLLLPRDAGKLSAADVNGDRLPDLLTTLLTTGSQLFINLGNGRFSPPIDGPARAVRLADVDGDGLADLVGYEGSNVLIWPGNGSGYFLGSPITFTTGGTPSVELVVADIDRDGRADIADSGFILYGLGSFSYQLAALPSEGPVLVGDFDGNNIADLALPKAQRVLFGRGNRTFQEVSSPIPVVSLGFYAVADFNLDHLDDLALSNDDVLHILLSRGNGTFLMYSVLNLTSRTFEIAAADFNSDGRPDVVAGLFLAQEMALLGNNPQGSFDRAFFASGASCIALVVADFDLNGRPDIAYSNYNLDRPTNNILVMLNKQ